MRVDLPSDEWGVGRYEETAAELQPAAEEAVAALALDPGASVLDVACGSGNAAAVATAEGALVSGIDSSARLIAVARERIPQGEFVVGDAARLPYPDGAFDAAVSVFGVIFASPAERAAGELARVVRRGGRLAITTWPSRGPVFEVVSLMRQALARVRPPEGPPPMDWGDPAVLERLLGRYGRLDVSERTLAYDGSSPEQAWERRERLHPVWVRARRVLEPAGEWEALRADSIASMSASAREGATESPYLLATLVRD